MKLTLTSCVPHFLSSLSRVLPGIGLDPGATQPAEQHDGAGPLRAAGPPLAPPGGPPALTDWTAAITPISTHSWEPEPVGGNQ